MISHRPAIFPRVVGCCSRRVAFTTVALASATLLACSDQPSAPSPAIVSGAAAAADRFDVNSAASTLEWEATARQLVVTHTTVNPLIAGRIYALLGVAQYGAVVGSDESDPVSGGRAL